MRKKYRTVSFPDELIKQIESIITETGFRSPTEFILYITRRTVAKILNQKGGIEKVINDISPREANKIKDKLRKLGYLE